MFRTCKSGRGQEEGAESHDDEGILVRYEDHKRILPLTKDDQVANLRYQFLRVFSDILEDQVAPAQVMFQRYHSGVQEYVDVLEDTKLERGDKLNAIVKRRGKNVKDTIRDDAQYRLWSLSSRTGGALLVRNPSSDVVSCSGVFDNPSQAINTVVRASMVIKRREPLLYGLIFEDSSKERYAAQANGAEKEITAVKLNANDPLSDEQLYEVDSYWGYTMYKSFKYRTLYLGCDENGKATLLNIGSPSYPNPQTLFIVNEIKGDTLPVEA